MRRPLAWLILLEVVVVVRVEVHELGLVGLGVRHAGRRVNERSRAALRRRPLRAAAALLSLAITLSACGGGASRRPTVEAQGPRHVSALAFDASGRLWATAAGLTDHKGDGLYLITPGGRAVEVAGGLVDPLGLLWVDGKLPLVGSMKSGTFASVSSGES